MSNPFNGFDDNELGGGSPDDISEDGMYLFKVLSAYDSYKTDPSDKDDPEQSRRINLEIQVLDAVQDTRNGSKEMAEDVERRRSQRGNVSRVSLWFDEDGNASLIEGNMKILADIAGSPQGDKPSEELLKNYYKGKEDGEAVFELGQIGDQMHVNCSSLEGRDFIAVIQNTEEEYPSFFPWYAERVPDEKQSTYTDPETGEETVQERSSLFSGTDHASQRMKEIFEDSDSSSGGQEPEYEAEEPVSEDIDDDLPF